MGIFHAGSTQKKEFKLESNYEITITQLADDTTCFVKDKTSLCHLLDVFKQYQRCAGLKMNKGKTKAKILGPEPQSLANDMRRLFLFNVATVVLFPY